MDLVAGVKRVIAVMEHVAKSGRSNSSNGLPLTGQGCVDMVVTDLCVLSRAGKGKPFQIIELAIGVAFDDVPDPAIDQSGLRRKRFVSPVCRLCV